MVAFAKLQELIEGRPITYPGQKIVQPRPARRDRRRLGIALVAGVRGRVAAVGDDRRSALVFGVLFVLPIGGADMPVVISLLNAFTGLAAAGGGFELENNVLIVSGMLVGASGTLLTMMMGKAMNRSIANVLFGAFGQVTRRQRHAARRRAARCARRPRRGRRRHARVRAARSSIVPGYGMAVAQAQHDVRELADLLESKGVEVTYAIHPVAGRMPGHMNVLLAEANVPYTALKEMDDVEPGVPAHRRRRS